MPDEFGFYLVRSGGRLFSLQILNALSFPGMFISGIFTNDPFPYVRPAMEKFDAIFLAGIEKSNDFDIHECHTLEVKRAEQLLAIDLPLQYIEMLRLQPTA
jgi:hypothetical protein